MYQKKTLATRHECSQKVWGNVPLLLVDTYEIAPEVLCPVWGSSGQVQIVICWSAAYGTKVVGAGAHDGEATGTGLVQPGEVKAKRSSY